MNTYLHKEIPLQTRLTNAAKNRFSDFRCMLETLDALADMPLEDYFVLSPNHYENLNEYFDLTLDQTYGDLANMIYQMRNNLDNESAVIADEDCIPEEDDFRTVMYNFVEPFNDYYNFLAAEKEKRIQFAAMYKDENIEDLEELLIQSNNVDAPKYITKIPLKDRIKLSKKKRATLFDVGHTTIYNYLQGISEYTNNERYKKFRPAITGMDIDNKSLLNYVRNVSECYVDISPDKLPFSTYDHLYILLVLPFSNKKSNLYAV